MTQTGKKGAEAKPNEPLLTSCYSRVGDIYRPVLNIKLMQLYPSIKCLRVLGILLFLCFIRTVVYLWDPYIGVSYDQGR